MKENKTNWWVIISVAIVVAVVSSLITISITGNIIKQNTNPYGMYQLYTKPEIDSKLNSINLSLKNLNNSLNNLTNIEICAKYFSVSEGKMAFNKITNTSYFVNISYIINISSPQVKLMIGSNRGIQETNLLSTGGSFKLLDGTLVTIKKIFYDSKDTGISSVDIVLNNC